MAQVNDVIQLTYFRELHPVMEVVQSFYVSEDRDWVYLKSGKYRKNKVKSYRNLTAEKLPPAVEDE